jgi:tetratricopeptide (TPR) repeat protein
MPWQVLALFASAHMVNQDAAPLRSSCDSEAQVIGKAAKGDAAQILFAISGDIGTCYKVALISGGKTVQGYLPAKALSDIESFDQARRAAGRIEVPAEVRREIVQRTAAGSGDAGRIRQLMASGQNEQALELLQGLIKRGHRDAHTLAAAGLAALQSDQPKIALDYFTQSLALNPGAAIEDLRQRAAREVAADRSGEKLVGIKFNFRYDDQAVSADQARALVPILDGEFTRISEALGCRSEERMTAIVQTPEAYRQSTGAAEWSAGQYDGRIRVALLEKTPGDYTRQTFAHEIVHACLARTGDWPAWLHEGLAQKLSGQVIPEQQRAEVRRMARAGELPKLEEMGRSWSRASASHAALAYATALLAIENLYDAYGPSGVRNLLQNPSSLARVAADIDSRLRE